MCVCVYIYIYIYIYIYKQWGNSGIYAAQGFTSNKLEKIGVWVILCLYATILLY